MKKQAFLITLLAVLLVPVFANAQQEELGLASYYSDLFHGKPTASGELYDKNKMTAAHKTLPFGTIIKVTRLDNGKSVQVRVNDRGPYISGRIVELSRAAAEKIDLVRDGVTRVKVEVVTEDANKETTASTTAETPKEKNTVSSKGATESTVTKESKTAPAKAKTVATSSSKAKSGAVTSTAGLYEVSLKREDMKGYGVQVAAFKSEDAMFKKVEELKAQWFDKVLVSVAESKNGEKMYKIILGSFATKTEAEEYKKNLKKNKKMDGFVVDLSQLAQ